MQMDAFCCSRGFPVPGLNCWIVGFHSFWKNLKIFNLFPHISTIFIFFPSYFVGILLMNSRSFSLYPVLSSPPVMRYVVSTWQAFWGHDLPKPTHLLTNISHLGRSAGNWFRLGVVRCKSWRWFSHACVFLAFFGNTKPWYYNVRNPWKSLPWVWNWLKDFESIECRYVQKMKRTMTAKRRKHYKAPGFHLGGARLNYLSFVYICFFYTMDMNHPIISQWSSFCTPRKSW
jgi:hypothetical protein